MSFYDDASWLLIPSGIEEDIVFAQKPISGLGDLTFTRASDATYTDASGVVRRSPYNLLQQSEAFNVSPWGLARTSAFGSGSVINDTTAPNGTLTAQYIQQASGQTLGGGVFVQMSYIANQSYTLSVYAKKKENNYLRLGFSIGAGGLGLFGNFDLNTGVAGTPDAGVTQTIQDVGNGWYRCSISATAQLTISANTFIYQSSTLNSPTTTPLQGIYIWGAQLVEGTSALDYFPTTNRQDVPRIDFRNADGTLSSCGRLLLEPQRTNSIRNSSMVGAVTGSPGTLPTNWIASNAGLTQTIVGVGTELGLPYVDIRLNGTASGAFFNLFTEGPTQVVASNGQTWTNAMYMKIVAAPNPYNSILNNFSERTAAGSLLVGTQQAITLTSTLTRFSFTRTNTNAATERINGGYQGTLTVGQTYDFTIRIAAPQMELGAFATTWVPTTTAAVTRLADTASKTGVSSLIGQTEGTLFIDFELISINQSNVRVFTINDTTISNVIRTEIFQLSSTVFQFRTGITTAGVDQGDSFTTITQLRNKIAISYGLNDVKIYINGSLVATDTTVNIPANSALFLANRSNLAAFGAVSFAQYALFPTRLTNAQLAQLTTL